METEHWDQTVDVLVIGSGNAALTAALCSYEMGAKNVLVVEKSEVYGGTSATSGGMIWIPGNPPGIKDGLQDSYEEAFNYLRETIPPENFRAEMIDAFLVNGPEMIDFLHERTPVRFRAVAKYPDYHTDVRGAKTGLRGLEPEPLNADALGEDFATLRPGHSFWYMFGVIPVTMKEAHDIPVKAKGWRWTLAKLVLSYGLDIGWRFKSRFARRLTVGCAGIARLRLGLKERGIPIWLNTAMTKLIERDGQVVGAVVTSKGTEMRVRALKGVVLAAGGFEHNQDMRVKYLPKPTNRAWSASATVTNTGDAINEGMKLGAATKLLNKAWWCTTMSVPGEAVPRLSIQDKAWPGTCLVNKTGRRFVNESENYMSLQERLYEAHTDEVPCSPAYQIFDASFRRKYLIGPLLTADLKPDWTFPKRWYTEGFIAKASTIEELADKVGIDRAGLVETIRRMNEYAKTGKDLDFQRGDAAYDRYYSDPTVTPNPCLAPIAEPPFYALRIDAGDIGTQGGLLTDPNGQVMREDGSRIRGLYAAGNCSAAILPTYPGPGATLGPAMVFAYQAAKHMTGYNMTRAASAMEAGRPERNDATRAKA